MSPYGRIPLMAERTPIQRRFSGPEKPPYQRQSLVLLGNFCSRQGSIRAEHIFAVKMDFRLDFGGIEADGTIHFFRNRR